MRACAANNENHDSDPTQFLRGMCGISVCIRGPTVFYGIDLTNNNNGLTIIFNGHFLSLISNDPQFRRTTIGFDMVLVTMGAALWEHLYLGVSVSSSMSAENKRRATTGVESW